MTRLRHNLSDFCARGTRVLNSWLFLQVKKADHIHETKGQNRALKYLDSWDAFQSGDNPDWKFQKVPQIWLLANVYNSDKVPDKKFDLLLKYMDSIKGQMRKKATGTGLSCFLFYSTLNVIRKPNYSECLKSGHFRGSPTIRNWDKLS